MKFFSIIFCGKCGSTLVDVFSWKDTRTATIRCCDCHQSTTLTGFTLGRTGTETCSTEKALEEAEADKAAPDPAIVPKPRKKKAKRRDAGQIEAARAARREQ